MVFSTRKSMQRIMKHTSNHRLQWLGRPPTLALPNSRWRTERFRYILLLIVLTFVTCIHHVVIRSNGWASTRRQGRRWWWPRVTSRVRLELRLMLCDRDHRRCRYDVQRLCLHCVGLLWTGLGHGSRRTIVRGPRWWWETRKTTKLFLFLLHQTNQVVPLVPESAVIVLGIILNGIFVAEQNTTVIIYLVRHSNDFVFLSKHLLLKFACTLIK